MDDAPKRKRGNPNWQPGGKDHRPASGMPASGEPASGISAGPASHNDRPAFTADNQPSPDLKAAGHAAKAEMVAYMVSKRMVAASRIVALIDDPEAGAQVQLNASVQLLNRLDGTPSPSVPDGEDKPATTAFRWATDIEIQNRD